jgi:hypothetical protein
MNWVFQSHPEAVIASGGRAWKPKIEKYGNIWDNFSCDYIYPNDVHVMSFSRHWEKSYGEVSEKIFGTKKGPNGYISSCEDMGSGGQNPYVQEHAICKPVSPATGLISTRPCRLPKAFSRPLWDAWQPIPARN